MEYFDTLQTQKFTNRSTGRAVAIRVSGGSAEQDRDIVSVALVRCVKTSS